MFEEQGKLAKTQKITEKPCNENFRVLSAEAKNTIHSRFYNNKSAIQW
jgi:hypothetical protein